MSTSTITIDGLGAVRIPDDLRLRSGLLPNTPVRIVETRHGVLVVPLTEEPIPPELTEELQAWQSLGEAAWGLFPYEEQDQ